MGRRTIRVGKQKLVVDPARVRVIGKRLDSLAWLDQVPEVRELSLHDNHLATLADLPPLPNLRELSIRGNPLRDLRGIERLPKLAQLAAWDSPIARPHAIADAKGLETVSITPATRDLMFLGEHPQLRYLAVTGELRSLRGFERCPALGELIVHSMPMARPTLASPVLWKLFLEECGLVDVPRLDTPELLILGLRGNPLRHLANLAHLPKLRDLIVDGRKLASIDAATDAMIRARQIRIRGLRAKVIVSTDLCE